MAADTRPSPEALLRDAQRAGRGKLKVFLGAAPGVGKTFAMLRAAQRARADGVDVCVGLIETHGRAETEAQLAGLETLARAHRVSQSSLRGTGCRGGAGAPTRAGAGR